MRLRTADPHLVADDAEWHDLAPISGQHPWESPRTIRVAVRDHLIRFIHRGPQFQRMWKDLDWHHSLTHRINAAFAPSVDAPTVSARATA